MRRATGFAVKRGEIYDFIVVGGGSAGCVVAARLAEDENISVLLIEAGSADWHPFYKAPAGFAKMLTDKSTWGWWTTPQKYLGDMRYLYPQGRVLGGGSSINAQIYTRGNARDYDVWANDCGCEGWSYADILPYFKRAEDNDSLSNAFHSWGGPLGVSRPVNPLPISYAFIEAAKEAGIPYSLDFNGESQFGFGLYQTTTRNSARSSTARAYLHRRGRQKNLTVMTGQLVRRVILDQNRVTGIEFESYRGSDRRIVSAAREIIVTSGAIGTPALLMRSGIGAREELVEHGIDSLHVLEGVGKNLQDHFDLYAIAECSGDYTYDKHDRPIRMVMSGLQYLAFGTGPAASNLVEAGGFTSTTGDNDWPDMQFHVVLGSGLNDQENKLQHCGVTLNTAYMRPKSVGTVRLQSADPRHAPLIDPNFLEHPEDRERSIAGFRLAREILSQSSLSKYLKREILPGRQIQTDEEILQNASKFSKTDYHPVGTCKMGVDDRSVVDPQTLKVHGLKNLRICDSSIMPKIISSNTNAITIAIAEKAADLIKAGQ